MAFAKKLFFTVLFLSILTEAQTTYKDPWSGSFSWYFHADLKSWLPQTGIPLNPFEITIIVIFLAWALRGRRDRRFHFERGLLFWPIVVFSGLILLSLLWGQVRPGGDFIVALWEVRALYYGIIAYFLIGILFTHRRDLDTLTWVILISAALMGFEGIIRYLFFLPDHAVGDLDYDHENAILLACAIVLSLAMLLLGSNRRQKLFVLASLPVDIIGMMVTYRRAGFAALVIGLVFLALILLRVNTRLFMKIVPATALIFAIYVGAFWGCDYGALCQPARAIYSQFDPNARDAQSDQYREIERYDLILNIQANPVTGLGFGQPYTFYIPLPDLSFWEFWHYIPHNEILWVWVKMGMFGFMGFWWIIASALYRSGRLTQALSAAGDYKARALLAAAACLIVMQMTVSYVDLGLTSDRIMLLLGVMLGVIGHLPGILRRSIHADQPTPTLRSVDEKITHVLERETPEVQVGVLAHALMLPGEPANPPRRDPWSARQNPPKREEPRWSQHNGAYHNGGNSNGAPSNGATGWGHRSRPLAGPPSAHTSHPLAGSQQPPMSRPLAGASPPHRSRPLATGMSVSPASEDDFFDDLPWVKHTREEP